MLYWLFVCFISLGSPATVEVNYFNNENFMIYSSSEDNPLLCNDKELSIPLGCKVTMEKKECFDKCVIIDENENYKSFEFYVKTGENQALLGYYNGSLLTLIPFSIKKTITKVNFFNVTSFWFVTLGFSFCENKDSAIIKLID